MKTNIGQAIELATAICRDLEFVDSSKVTCARFLPRSLKLAEGVRDCEEVRDSWMVVFARKPMPGPFHDLPDLIVSVDDSTRNAVIIPSL